MLFEVRMSLSIVKSFGHITFKNWRQRQQSNVKFMDVLEAIEGRRSIRAFRNKNVSPETVEKLINASRLAPSAGNIQPWKFIIVRKPEIKKELVEAALGQTFIEESPVVIVVCADENLSSQGYGLRGKTLYCLQDTAAAIQNILLAAHSLGLGTCWIGAFHEEDVATTLKTPRGVRPIAIIPVGYAAEKPSPRSRRPIDQIVYHETFSDRS
jgi:nitroreductase